MSGTISIIPLAIYAIMSMAGATSGLSGNEILSDESLAERERFNNKLKQSVKESMMNGTPEYINVDTASQICNEYKTVFMDEEVLEKTLQEYGFNDYTVENGTIVCKLGNFSVEFYRKVNEPYMMKISCSDSSQCEEFISDIQSEYAQNVQEESYIKIKERLKKHNLQIEKEEVLDDDSIMITVNLE